ncbi:GDSL-type esterase/lipase family protein [Sphingomonas psychrotolerans]|uniref:GDSL-type esterase/lipase family protein n=1 Tax=Sphingomonas psychrotolerans TaxID=1327635 RepID=A0ABU3MZ64_9SPHN|nr:GDSL-type esterase/lipase family protein [Sphingomonas psychrotolerans]MDT8757433.1 GDSL-type esterase/lipase family protein [Sphingomonas psychrotolerans]
MSRIVRRGFLAGALALPLAAQARVQESGEEKRQRQLREDWPWLGRYAEENRKLLASGVKTNILFMGDSITEGWRRQRPDFFRPGRVGRGIGGQTTPQMVLRMMSDVVALKPRYLHIMAATNDVAGNTGPMTLAQTFDNFRMMVAIAQANRIQVLLASVPPADHFPWRPGLETVKPIRAINQWLKAYAKTVGATWIDYWPVLADEKGAMKPGLAADGVHPTDQGYDLMATVIEPFLRARKI